MREIIKLKRVSVRNDAEACVTRLMRETWHLIRLDIIFKNSFKLHQIVNFPTRGNNILDLILTNRKKVYDPPITSP